MISGSDALLVGRIARINVRRRLYSDCGGESGDRRRLGQEMVRRWKGNSAPLGLTGRAPGEEVHPGGLSESLGVDGPCWRMANRARSSRWIFELSVTLTL